MSNRLQKYKYSFKLYHVLLSFLIKWKTMVKTYRLLTRLIATTYKADNAL